MIVAEGTRRRKSFNDIKVPREIGDRNTLPSLSKAQSNLSFKDNSKVRKEHN